MAKKYSAVEKQQINLEAKRKAGLIKKDDYEDFIESCTQNLMDSGEFSSEEDAEAVCEVLWEEGGEDD